MWLIDLFQSDYTLRIVSLGSALLGIVSGVIGSFAVLRKQGLLGDAVSHAALPGIAIMFIFLQTKDALLFMLGALIAGLIGTGLIVAINRYTRIKVDSAMAFILSVFFGFGLVLLTYIQKLPNANQAGLDKFIFGQASTLLKRDVQLIAVVGAILLVLVALFWKELKIVSFDRDFADSLGISSRFVSLLLSAMIVLSIIIGLQAVGVILMSALLIAPGVAARQWTDRLVIMVLLAGFFGAISGLLGTLISSLVSKLPTGPTIVIIISLIVVISLLFAPNRGLLWQYIRDRKRRKDISEDAALYNLYLLARNHNDLTHGHDISAIKPTKFRHSNDYMPLKRILENLQSNGYVEQLYFDKWHITPAGVDYLQDNQLVRED